jgi:hypothetical protein
MIQDFIPLKIKTDFSSLMANYFICISGIIYSWLYLQDVYRIWPFLPSTLVQNLNTLCLHNCQSLLPALPHTASIPASFQLALVMGEMVSQIVTLLCSNLPGIPSPIYVSGPPLSPLTSYPLFFPLYSSPMELLALWTLEAHSCSLAFTLAFLSASSALPPCPFVQCC